MMRFLLMMALGSLLVSALAGCSDGESTVAALDLAVPPPCTLAFSGDESGSLVCFQRFCGSATAAGLQLYGGEVGSFMGVFGVDGAFTLGRTYAAGDLSSFTVGARFAFTRTYVAGSQVAGSTVALTFDEIEPNNNVDCSSGNATAHGTARVSLIESLDADAGTQPPRHVTVVASF